MLDAEIMTTLSDWLDNFYSEAFHQDDFQCLEISLTLWSSQCLPAVSVCALTNVCIYDIAISSSFPALLQTPGKLILSAAVVSQESLLLILFFGLFSSSIEKPQNKLLDWCDVFCFVLCVLFCLFSLRPCRHTGRDFVF